MTPLDELRSRCATSLPHPDSVALEQLGQETLTWVINHFRTLSDQPIGHSASRTQLESLLRRDPSPEGKPLTELLREFEQVIAHYAFRTNHPRFLAFVPGAPCFPSVLGELLIAGTNFFGGVWLEAAGPSQIELIVLDWFKQFLGYPTEASGVLVSGGSEANLTALVVARDQLPIADRGRALVYLTEQRHWSIDRAARIIGLLPEQLRPVPADAEYRMKVSALRQAIEADRARGLKPWVVVANAGATNTGVVDPLNTLADVCSEAELWLHVDAAYGWAGVLCETGKRELAGIERADSLTLDPHKWFAQTFDAGCLLVKRGELLARSFVMRPEYMQDVEPNEDEVNFADRSLALTRRFRALKIWLSLELFGLNWFRRLADHCCALADYGQALLEQAGFEILSPRHLSIVCFRYRPAREVSNEELNTLNLRLVDALRATRGAFLSSTRLNGRVAIRLCFVNWRTTAADVAEIVKRLAELASE